MAPSCNWSLTLFVDTRPNFGDHEMAPIAQAGEELAEYLPQSILQAKGKRLTGLAGRLLVGGQGFREARCRSPGVVTYVDCSCLASGKRKKEKKEEKEKNSGGWLYPNQTSFTHSLPQALNS